MYYSQYGQDQFLDRYIFKGFSEGIFLDIGAYDGVALSNSCFFERKKGWKGICVEPVYDRFVELQKNRHCFTEHGCVSNQDEEADFYEVSGAPAMLSGLQHFYDENHLKRIHSEIQQEGGAITIKKVRCFTPQSLLKKYEFPTIHYCSIDTEGNEMAILKSIDFTHTFIHVFTIENNYHNNENRTFLKKHGYSKVWNLGCDEVFIHQDSPFYTSRLNLSKAIVGEKLKKLVGAR
jgi:FkbM family methyltransferase